MLKKILFIYIFSVPFISNAMDAPASKAVIAADKHQLHLITNDQLVITEEGPHTFINELLTQKYEAIERALSSLPSESYKFIKSQFNKMYSVTEPRLLHAFLHQEPVTSAAISADGGTFLTGSDDGIARIWDLSQHEPVCRLLKGHTERITAVALSTDGKRAVTGSHDKTARVWDLTEPQPTCKILTHSSAVVLIAFNPITDRSSLPHPLIILLVCGTLRHLPFPISFFAVKGL